MRRLKGGQLLIDISSQDIGLLEGGGSTQEVDLFPIFSNIVSRDYDSDSQKLLDYIILSKSVIIRIKNSDQLYNIPLVKITNTGVLSDVISFDFTLGSVDFRFNIRNLTGDEETQLKGFIERLN